MPPHPRPLLTRLLAILLLAQWAAGFAHRPAPADAAADGYSVEICAADGLKTVRLGADGDPAERPAAVHHTTCPECCGPAALEPPSPAGAAVPVVWAAAAPARPAEGLPVAPARAPPQQPRAPPVA